MYQTLEVAAISFVPVKFALEDNAARLEAAFRKAARGGAQLALAPEGILEGYVTNEIIRKEAPASRMREVAVQIDGPEIGRFRRLARELDMCLAFGCAELIEDEVFNCALFIDHRGKLRGNYHKMQLAEGYHKSWWYNRIGSSSRAVATPHGKCGFLICNDRWNPLLARVPVLDGARFLLIPSYGSRSKKQDRAVLARARENGVPIVEANVGVTLIISKGEIVTVSRKEDTVTFGTIEIPAPPSSRNRDRQEEAFLKNRRENLPRLNRRRLEMLRQVRK